MLLRDLQAIFYVKLLLAMRMIGTLISIPLYCIPSDALNEGGGRGDLFPFNGCFWSHDQGFFPEVFVFRVSLRFIHSYSQLNDDKPILIEIFCGIYTANTYVYYPNEKTFFLIYDTICAMPLKQQRNL